MDNTTVPPKRKLRKILKIFLWFIIPLVLLTGGIFTFGYFYYGKIIRNLLIENVKNGSRGLYRAELGSLYLNILDGNLSLRRLELIPDTGFYRKQANKDSLSPLLFRLYVDHFNVMDFHLWSALRERTINIESIQILSPEITVFRMHASNKAGEKKRSDKPMGILLPKGLVSVLIKEIELRNGKLDFFDLSGDTIIHQSIPSCNIMISNVLVDSLHKGESNLFNAGDISVKIKDISFRTKTGLNLISFAEIGLSTGSNSLYVNGFHLIPQYNRFDYTRKLGFQTDRMDIFVGKLNVQRFDFTELILGGKIHAGLLEIDSLVLDNYRDKRVPRKPGFKPPMPQDGIRNLKTYLKIDTVLLHNGKATYSEQVDKEAGIIYFDKMEAVFTGLTNDSTLLNSGLVSELKGTAWLMGKGKLDASFRFRFGDTRNSFTFSAHLGPMDLREINPMLTKLQPAEIKSGKIEQLVVPEVTANDDVATGKLLFYYSDLHISVTTKKETTWNSIKQGVINFIANDLVVNNENPTKSGKMKTGIICFKRDKEKGIINYLWKSAFSGLKSTMGFNSKDQKEMKKAEKKAKK